jgi:choline dehydrogenase-like flavoprotein
VIKNLNEFPVDEEIITDVCIVGAGAAGISMARQFAGQAFKVCLLEAGDLELDARTQALYKGEIVGYPYYPLDAIRLRFFGGTTNHWAGACRPLDERDFEVRQNIPDSGWPIRKSDLDPYYERAHSVCQLGEYNYDPALWETEGSKRLSFVDEDISTAMMQINAVRFGSQYLNELRGADNVDVVLGANVVELQASEGNGRISAVRSRSLSGRNLTVRSTLFVLATGAVENVRLLLNSSGVQDGGIGNQNDMVGRCFMEHLSVPGANLVTSNVDSQPGQLYQGATVDGTNAKAFLVPSADLQKNEGILNIRAFISSTPVEELSAKSSDGVLSAGFIWNDIRNGQVPRNLANHLQTVIRDIDGVAHYSYQLAYAPRDFGFSLVHHVEQAPNRNSRVLLSDSVDEFDARRIQLDWQFGELERRTLERFNINLGMAVGRAGIGRLNIIENEPGSAWPAGLRGAWHQMGTTRMSDSPATGVVDGNCLVHGTKNLYIAGSSVFATSGYTNPTLTIVALALRLADLIERLSK